jgi:predicted nucleic acid-binding protein
MSDRVFLDTNILVYATLQDDRSKHEQAVSFITTLKGGLVFISTQVTSELYVALLKHGIDDSDIVKTVKQIAATFNIIAISF